MELKDLITESYYYDKSGLLLNGDCLEWMQKIPDRSIDMILCDLPYGTTQNKWDSIIDLGLLWKEYLRIIKDNTAIVLNSGEPFTSILICSNLELFKYRWTWVKNRATGFLNAKKRPLKLVEDICVFINGQKYNPQGILRIDKVMKNSKSVGGDSTGDVAYGQEYTQEFTNYPKDVLSFGLDEKTKLHPTQKPVELLEYLIQTYSKENDVVLDNCSGSGSTAIACKNTKRKWICIEKEQKYCEIAKNRLINQ